MYKHLNYTFFANHNIISLRSLYRAEQLAIAQKMEDRQANTPGRSKVKRRGSTGGTLKRHKFVSQDRLDESSFGKFNFIYLIHLL